MRNTDGPICQVTSLGLSPNPLVCFPSFTLVFFPSPTTLHSAVPLFNLLLFHKRLYHSSVLLCCLSVRNTNAYKSRLSSSSTFFFIDLYFFHFFSFFSSTVKNVAAVLSPAPSESVTAIAAATTTSPICAALTRMGAGNSFFLCRAAILAAQSAFDNSVKEMRKNKPLHRIPQLRLHAFILAGESKALQCNMIC